MLGLRQPNSSNKQCGHQFVGPVKTNTKNFPKVAIKTRWPIGMEGTMASGVQLLAIGYKYNSRKVLCFVVTNKGAGSTSLGTPYQAKFADGWGNVMMQLVPYLISSHSSFKSIMQPVDTHNQA